MAVVTFANKYSPSDNFKNGALLGAALLTSHYHAIRYQDTLTVSHGDRIIHWYTLNSVHITFPLPFTVRSAFGLVDPYTLDCDYRCYAGGIFLGTESDVPILDTTDLDTSVNDLLSSSLIYALAEDTDMSYSFLQCAYMIMSLAERSIVPNINTKDSVIKVTPYGL